MRRHTALLSLVLFSAAFILHLYEGLAHEDNKEASILCRKFCQKYCQEPFYLENKDLCEYCGCQAKESLSKVCLDPKVDAPFCERYYFDKKRQLCVKNPYGYCKITGRQNNFKTLRDCAMACPNPTQNFDCKLPKLIGPCTSGLKRYYYNRETMACERFIYGGCEGNANNYKTFNECEKACGMYKYEG